MSRSKTSWAPKWLMPLAALSIVSALASNSLASGTDELSPITSVTLVLVGPASADASLFRRIQSLYDAGTQLAFATAVQLDPDAVLKPKVLGQLYIWITLQSNLRARIYVALRDNTAEAARYLYRDVKLESGLDEIGSETLAQVAHSSSRALWMHEQQVSRSAVVKALELDDRATSPKEPPPSSGPPSTSAAATPPSAPKGNDAPRAEPRQVRFGLAAEYGVRAAGGEGWLQEPGGEFSAVFVERLLVRVGTTYTVPHPIDAPFTRIHLEGITTALRVGWRARPTHGWRGYLDGGFGIFFAHWSAESHAPAVSQNEQNEQRPFAVASLGVEREISAVTLGARAQLRIPFQTTSYEVTGTENNTWKTESRLSPGVAIQVGVPLD